METTEAVRGLDCIDCGAAVDPERAGTRCADCGGLLTVAYEGTRAVTAADVDDRSVTGPFRYREFLPFAREDSVTIDEGATPLVDCPTLAEDLGVASVAIKDEGQNPTGAVTDRGLAVAVTAAARSGATDVALPTTGSGGQSAAAYAARADLDSHSFVPTRSPFVNKAMVNVHGGDMTVVEGRYPDAAAAYESGCEDDWTPVDPASPYRREGLKTLYHEIVDDRDWTAPDAVVVPAGHGIALAGVHAAIEELRAADLVAEAPRLYAAQPDGCAPIATACLEDRAVEAVEYPDSIVGSLEVADPAAGDLAAAAVRETDGDGVTVADDDALQAAVDVASEEGVEAAPAGGVALAGARKLAAEDAFDADEEVVLLNPVAGSKEDDVLRSHLMSQGR